MENRNEKNREHKTANWKKRVVAILGGIVVFITTYALLLPAITITKEAAEEEPGIVLSESYSAPEEAMTADGGAEAAVSEPAAAEPAAEPAAAPEESAAAPAETAGETTETAETGETDVTATPAGEPGPAPAEGESAAEGEPAETAEPGETAEPAETPEATPSDIVLTGEQEQTADALGLSAEEAELVVDAAVEEVVYEDTDENPEEVDYSVFVQAGDPYADVESSSDWAAMFRNMDLTGVWADDLLAVAKSQLGYTESTANYIVNENGEQKGYTRFGAWYGIPYGDWCAMFISFCMEYADIPTDQFPHAAGCGVWRDQLRAMGQWAWASDGYTPKPGDVVFFTFHNGTADHVGIVYDVWQDAYGTWKLTTIEGNSSNRVQFVNYDLGSSTILGYGILPDSHPAQSFYAETGDINVSVEADRGAFPYGATMRVAPVYDEGILSAATDVVEGEVRHVAAVDITFYDRNGYEIEPLIPIRVSLTSDIVAEAQADSDATATVVHVDDAGDAAVMREAPVASAADEVVFDTDAFSVYAIVTAVTFEKTLTASDGNVYSISVTYADGSGIPSGAELVVNELVQGTAEYDIYVQRSMDQLSVSADELGFARAFDIYLLDPATGEHIQPSQDVQLSIALLQDEVNSDDISVVHFGSDRAQEMDCTVSDGFIDLDTDGFSVYVIVSSIEKTVLASDGHNYKITVTYGANAGIPAGADLEVSEVTDSSAEYAEYISMTENALGWDEGDAGYIRVFDIKIVDANGGKVQPAEGSTVDVKIELADKDSGEEAAANTKVVHFGDEIEVLESTTEGNTVSFETTGFSIYIVAEDAPIKRLKYTFKNGGATISEQYLKKIEALNVGTQTTEMVYTSLYEPSLTLEYGQNCIGWAEDPRETDPAKIFSIEQLQLKAKERLDAEDLADGEEVVWYAILKEAYYLRYITQDASGKETILKTIIKDKDATNKSVTLDYTPSLSEGEIFEGWIDGLTGRKYNQNGAVDTVTLNQHMDLYLEIQGRNWLVFNSNKGTSSSSATYTPPQLLMDDLTTVKPDDPEMIGYTFTGWNTKADGTGEQWLTVQRAYNEENELVITYPVNKFGGGLEDDTVLYAQWSANENIYRIAYWRQKETDAVGLADEDKTYDFYGYREITTNRTGDTVQATNNDRNMAWVANLLEKTLGDENKFSFNTANSDTGTKTVQSDGSTVFNMYFDRATMTFIFDQSFNGYTQTTDTTGTLYGYVNGEFVELNKEGETTSTTTEYFLTQDQNGTTAYTGTIYSDQYGTVATNPTYPNTYYRRRTMGSYRQLYWNSRTETTTTYSSYTYTDANGQPQTYTGPRYKYGSTSQLQGLYGSQMKPGEWPSGFWQFGNQNANSYQGTWDGWNRVYGNRTTLNAAWTSYTISTAAYEYNKGTSPYTTWHLYSTNLTGDVTLVYWRQDENGEYKEEDAITTFGGSGGQLTIGNNKFYAFTMLGYEYGGTGGTPNSSGNTGEYGWHDLSNGVDQTLTMQSDHGPINIYYQRDKFNVTFVSNDATSQVRPYTEPVFYEKNLGFLKDWYTPDNSDGGYGMFFVGWYSDVNLTKPFDFENETMPHNDIVLYGKWDTFRTRVVLIPTPGNAHNDEVYFPNDQALKFRKDYGETIDGTNLQPDQVSRPGYKLIGWYTSPTFEESTLWNFNTELTDQVEAIDKTYQSSADWELNTYGDNDGKHDNVKGILKLYAKWELDIDENNVYVYYEMDDAYKLYDASGNLTTVIPVDTATHVMTEDGALNHLTIKEAPTGYKEGCTFEKWVLLNPDGTESNLEFYANATPDIPAEYIQEVTVVDDSGTEGKMHIIRFRAKITVDSNSDRATKITFDGNGGVTTDGGKPSYTEVIPVNASQWLTPATDAFTLPGYALVAWALDPETTAEDALDQLAGTSTGNVEVFAPESIVFADNLNISETNTDANTLYAVWKRLAPVTVTKLGAIMNGSVPLEGAEFTITNGDGTFTQTVVSGANGNFTLYLDKGTYTMTEAVTPAGYVENNEVYTIEVTAVGADVDHASEDRYTITGNGGSNTLLSGSQSEGYKITNTPVTTRIYLKKVDDNTESPTLLAGAQFDLYYVSSDNHTTHVRSITSTADASGVEISGLAVGTYKLVERNSPPGYIFTNSDTVFYVTLDGSNNLVVSLAGTEDPNYHPDAAFENSMLTITNHTGVELPHTGGAGTRAYAIAGGALAALGALGLMMARRRRKRGDAA